MSTISAEHSEVVQKAAEIIRCKWNGDCIYNTDAFFFRLGMARADFSVELRNALVNQSAQFSDLTGLPPRTLGLFGKWLDRGIRCAKRDAA